MTQENENLQNETISEEITENTTSENNEIATLRDQLARAQADYQNLKMRGERDRADMVHFLTEKLLSPLLTQIDNLDRAVKIKDGVTDDAFVDGVRAVQSGLQKYLENQGVKAFDSVGQEVDPDKHEVLSQAPGKEGIIVTEFEKGYMLGDRVLRHAKVIVGAGE
ncbi:nucleotide exchange factor GrpE [Candidatus Gracilibacteria bacterium GN02-873]|jgi:grpE|nr:nucleotide exchange factor GrpE [Candidatus Gracilibacteria bacterium GN02-873]